MTNLSLIKRCEIIKEKFNLKTFCPFTLRSYYLRFGVNFKRPDYTYWKTQAENLDLKEKQMEFVKKLTMMIREKK